MNRIAQRYNVDQEKAKHIIETRDRARQLNFKNMFGIEYPDSPSIYDVVINTSKISIKDSVKMVLNLVENELSFITWYLNHKEWNLPTRCDLNKNFVKFI